MLKKFGEVRRINMSDGYYSCVLCGETFPDCSYYVSCNKCKRHFCCDDCARMNFDMDANNPICCVCCDEDVDNVTLLEFLLKHFSLSKEDAIILWKNRL